MATLYGSRSLAFLTVVCVTHFITAGTSVFAREPSAAPTAPEAPSAPRPADSATDQMITVSFSWTGGGAVAYDVYFGTEEDPPLVASNISVPSYQGAVLDFETVYRWRVVARDQFGLETSGPVWSFITRFNSPPIVPFDPSPPHASLAEPTVVLHWRSGDPDQQPVTYRLLFGTTNPPPQLATGLTERSYALPLLEANRSYYWRVVASDGTFNVSSQVWRFYVMALAVMISKFDAVQAGDGVEVTWELSSDEAIAQVTLYRRTPSESLPVPIATLAADARSYRDDTVEAGRTYDYELLVRTVDGGEFRSPVATVTMRSHALALMQNHPNPFNPRTTISYDLPYGDASKRVRLVILDVAGRVVRTLVDEQQGGGAHAVEWDGKDNGGDAVSSGVYVSLLDVGGERRTRKLVLLK